MKLKILKEDIINGLQKAVSIIPSKTGSAYLRAVWLKAEDGKLSIMSTDSSIEFIGQYPAQVESEGLAGVQASAFTDLIRQLPAGEISLTLNRDEESDQSVMLLQHGRRRYMLPALSQDWFQNFSEFPAITPVLWSGDFFQEIIERISFCIDDDDSADALGCLFMKSVGDGRIEVCGLNRYQFAMVAFVHDDMAAHLPGEGLLVQKKYLPCIKKWLDNGEIEFNLTDKRIYLRSLEKSESLSLPRSINSYPDYSVFLATLDTENACPMSLDRKECMDILSRIRIFNDDVNPNTLIELGPEEAILSAQRHDIGSATENLAISYAGTLESIIFPSRKLYEALSHFTSARVDMIITADDGPCGIRGEEDKDYLVIIMPVKVQGESYYYDDEEK